MVKTFTQDELRLAVDRCVRQLEHYLPDFTDKFQYSNSENGFYEATENVEWTTGFLTGEYWLAYELTGKEIFKEVGLRHAQSFLERIEKRIDVDHHDMGFLYSPSCVAAYKLTGSEVGKKAAIMAADNLVSRFQEKGQFIQAWGELGAKDNYRLIIDCLLNVPLLFWAADVTGDENYRRIALAHTKTSVAHVVRDDNSTYHTFFFDPETGEPLRGVTRQGYRDGSAWARGQAWGVYGMALSYRHTQDPACIEMFERVTDFFIEHLPEDDVPYWDLDFTDGDGEPKDSSAAAAAVCGIYEMAPHLPKEKADKYMDAANRMLASLMRDYAVKSPEESNGLLLHGVYCKASPYNTVENRGVDECNTWGDYFYLEALTRATQEWDPYW